MSNATKRPRRLSKGELAMFDAAYSRAVNAQEDLSKWPRSTSEYLNGWYAGRLAAFQSIIEEHPSYLPSVFTVHCGDGYFGSNGGGETTITCKASHASYAALRWVLSNEERLIENLKPAPPPSRLVVQWWPSVEGVNSPSKAIERGIAVERQEIPSPANERLRITQIKDAMKGKGDADANRP